MIFHLQALVTIIIVVVLLLLLLLFYVSVPTDRMSYSFLQNIIIITINVVHEVQNKYKHKRKAKRKAKK